MKIKEFFKECKRVFKVTKKPTGSEFKKVLLVTGVGMLLIGLIGFLILMIYRSMFGGI